VNPFLLGALGAAMAVDTASTAPVLRDPEQAVKLARLFAPTLVSHAVAPWRLIGPGVSILRSTGSRGILDELARQHVPTFVIHGERDLFVPLCTAQSAAARAGGQLITVKKAGHSWPLKDPETLPAIVSSLLEDRLGTAIRNAITAAGAESVDELEDTFYADDAAILALTPELGWTEIDDTHRRPRFRWEIT
jgi:pimeloyl-ACP methyl ester carboxylesterase